jgi:hypothetical protein
MSKPVITCECGAEIPFIPDMSAMRKNIEVHSETHRKVAVDCSKTDAENQGEAELEVSRIKEALMKKALKLANL